MPTRRPRSLCRALLPALALLLACAPLASAQAVPLPADSRTLPLGAPAAAERTTPIGSGEDSSIIEIVRTLGSLTLVVGLIGALAFAAKWFAKKQGGLAGQLGAGGRAPSGVAQILARYPMSRGQTLVLMHIGSRVLVTFHATGGKAGPTMTPLCEITDPEEVADLLLKTREEEAAETQARFREAVESAEAAFDESTALKPKPSPFRRVQTSPAGDRVELLSTSAPTSSSPDALDAVSRLRARLSTLGEGVTA
jgi:flagellar biogenesis protein FliO